MSSTFDRMHKLEEELERLRKQVSTMKKLSGVAVGISAIAVLGVALLLMNNGSFPNLSLGIPNFPVSLSDLPKFSLPSNTNNQDKETGKDQTAIGSTPQYADADGDGLADAFETSIGTDPMVTNTDKDGLNDGDEIKLGSNPLVKNTDGDRYDDGVDHEPTVKNSASVTVTPYNLQAISKTENGVVVETLKGARYLNPYTALYYVQIDTDVKNNGTDYTSFVKYDVVFTINGEEVKRIPESLTKMDVGSSLNRHYEQEIRLVDLPKKVTDELSKGTPAEFSVDIQNISVEKF